MIDPIMAKLLNALLDKYEKSKSFVGGNKIQQSFQVRISELYPAYSDHADYEIFQEVNIAVDHLVRKGIVTARIDRSEVCKAIQLNMVAIDEAYRLLDRPSKQTFHSTIRAILARYQDRNEILQRYVAVQLQRLEQNKAIQYAGDDLQEYEQVLQAVAALLALKQETFYRDFSVQVFHDSKTFERVRGKVIALLFEYGDFSEKEQILADLNLVRNPTYVHVKGSAIVELNGNRLDLNSLQGDMAFSSALLPEIDRVTLTGRTVLTVENLTSFHTINSNNRLVIYLGGFHNAVRRAFIKKIHQQNPDASFYHFGDIDAGGFLILQHLRQQTGIRFMPYKMDLATLVRHQDLAKQLTDNDRSRLNKLRGQEFDNVIDYMLDHNIKLEQEAVREIVTDRL